MEKLRALVRERGAALAALTAVLLTVLVLGWALNRPVWAPEQHCGYSVGTPAGTGYLELKSGESLNQPVLLPKKGGVYGAKLWFTNYGEVQSGKVFVCLRTRSENLGQWMVDAQDIGENSPLDCVFDRAVEDAVNLPLWDGQDGTYLMVMYLDGHEGNHIGVQFRTEVMTNELGAELGIQGGATGTLHYRLIDRVSIWTVRQYLLPGAALLLAGALLVFAAVRGGTSKREERRALVLPEKLRKRVPLLLGGCVSVCAAAALLGWTMLQTGHAVDGQCRYTILNDEYTEIRELVPGEVLVQRFSLEPGAKLYGLRVDFATYNRVCDGAVHAELTAAQSGEVLARWDGPASALLDNTFADLIFSESPVEIRPAAALGNAELALRIWFEPETGEDRLGVWAAPTVQNTEAGGEMPLLVGDAAVGKVVGTMALQTISDYSGHWFRKLFLPVAVLLFGAVCLSWVLLLVRRCSHTLVLGVVGGLLGLAFAVVTPPLVAPDEYAHLAESYAMASDVMGAPAYNEEGCLLMRADDARYMSDVTGEVGIFAYKRMAEHLTDRADGEAVIPTKVRRSTNNVNLLYLPQTAGVLLARALCLGFFAMLLLGRLFNLAVYLLLCGAAIRQMPRGKTLMLCCALLPMSLQLGASFSPDALTIGMLYLWTALCFKSMENPLTKPRLAVMLVLAAFIGPSKGIYVAVVGLCFLIPAESFGSRKRALGGKLSFCFAAALAWALCNITYFRYIYADMDSDTLQKGVWSLIAAVLLAVGLWLPLRQYPKARRRLRNAGIAGVIAGIPVLLVLLGRMKGRLTPEQLAAGIQPNGDSVYTYTFGYICRNIPATAKIVVNTVGKQLPAWIQGVLGLSLGELIVYPVEVSWALGIGLILVLALAAMREEGASHRLPGKRRWAVLGICGLVCVLLVLACLTWTPINYTELFGVQGRYLLPILPLLLMVPGDWDGAVKRRDLTGEIVFAEVCLCGMVIAQGMSLYAML